jgi:hypothetical protein
MSLEYSVLDRIDEHDEMFNPEISDNAKAIIEVQESQDAIKAKYNTNTRTSPTYLEKYNKAVYRTSHSNRSRRPYVAPGLFRPEILRNNKDPKDIVNQDVDHILINVSEFLDLPDYTVARAKYLLAKTWNHEGQKQNYNNMDYEIAALGILKYCCEDLYEKPDFEAYVKLLYPRINKDTKLNQIKPKIRDLNRAYNKIKELCTIDNEKECTIPYELNVKLKLMSNYSIRHQSVVEPVEFIERLDYIRNLLESRTLRSRF